MANKFLTNIELDAGIVDGGNSTGTPGYLLSSTGSATSWVDPAAVAVGESEQVHIACKNTSGVAISKGDPVYITGTVGASYIIEIAKADASNSAKMPAVGLAETDLGLNAEGFVIVSGVLKNLTTDPLSTGDGTPSSNNTVYVKAGGGLTKTKPTGSGNLIQNVGKVGRVSSANAGSIAVSTIMRTNDVPNLTTGKIWVGSPTYTTESTVVHLDEPNGRMGIGTTSPSGKLTVDIDNSGTVLDLKRDDGVNGRLYITFGSAQSNFYSSGLYAFNVAGSEKMRINSSGNVGIGTTSPASKLNISSATYNDHITLTRSSDTLGISVSGGQLMFQGGASPFNDIDADLGRSDKHWREAFVYSVRSGGVLQFKTNGDNERMRIDTSGNVGIGTTSPTTAKLVVDTSSAIAASFGRDGTDGDVVQLYNGASGTTKVLALGASGNDGTIYSQFGDLILQQSAGNVGIGTTSPSQKLHVSGNARVTGAYYDSNNLPGTSGQVLSSTATGTDWVSLSEISGVDGTGTTNYVAKWADTDTITNSVIYDNGTNVGIGTTSPGAKLNVAGALGAVVGAGGSAIRLTNTDTGNYSSISAGLVGVHNAGMQFSTDGISRMVIDGSGNVGIGTVSPGAKLQVGDGTFDANARVLHSDSTYTEMRGYGIVTNRTTNYYRPTADKTQVLAIGNDGNTWNYIAHNANYHTFSTDLAERMRIDLGGNVGIGTTSPDVKLEVIDASPTDGIIADFVNSTNAGGTTAAIKLSNSDSESCDVVLGANRVGANFGSDFFISLSDSVDGSNQERFRITEAGDVGIGTTSPGRKLSVAGAIELTSSDMTIHTGHAAIRRGSAGEMFLDAPGDISVTIDTNNNNTDRVFNVRKDTGSELFRVQENGNVGIGTTSPGEKTTILTSNESLHDVLGVYNGVTGTSALGKGAAIRIGISTDGIYSTKIATIYEGNNPSYLQPALAFFTMNNTYLKGSEVERMRISANGNVGIGITAPNNLLNLSKDVADGDVAIYIQNFNSVVGSTNETTSLKFAHGNDGVVGYEAATVVGGKEGDFESNVANVKGFLSFSTASGTSLTNSVNIIERMRITGAGNVGIGTDNPGAKLEVYGSSPNILINNTDENDSGIVFTDAQAGTGQRAAIKFNSGDEKLKFFVNDEVAQRMVIDTSGNVGIGTTSPSATLEVKTGTSAGTVRLSSDGNGAIFSANGDLQFYTNNTAYATKFYSANKASTLATILDNGKVLVGVTGNQTQSKLTSRQNGSAIEFGHLNQSGQYYGTLGAMSSSGSPFIAFSADNSTSNSFTTRGAKGFVISQDTGLSGDLIFSSVPLVNTANQSLVEKMRITSAGGISFGSTGTAYGTSGQILKSNANASPTWVDASTVIGGPYLPLSAGSSYPLTGRLFTPSLSVQNQINTNSANLEINYENGDGTTTNYKDLYVRDGKNNVIMVVDGSAGNVGIGTDSPQSLLHIYKSNSGGIGGELRLDNNGSVVANKTRILFSDGSDRAAIVCETEGSPYQGQLQFQTGVSAISTKMVIKGDGNVGIGTTNPNEILHAAGNIHAYAAGGIEAGLYASTSSGITTVAVRSSGITHFNGGNVGIGTASPNAKLHVSTSDTTKFLGTNADYVAGSTGSGFLITTGASTGDTYSQIYSFQKGNTEYANLVVPGGNVGIGTTSPAAKLELSGASGQLLVLDDSSATGNPYMSFYQAGTRRSYIQHLDASDLLTFVSQYGGIKFMTGTGGTEVEKMRILADGNVGINTTAPTEKLAVTGNIETTESANGVKIGFNVGDSFTLNGSNTAHFGLSCGVSTSVPLVLSGYYGVAIATNGLERVRILQSNGYVGILNTAPSYALDVTGTIRATGNVIAFSDARAKENIKTIDSALEKVNKLRGVKFNKIGEEKTCIGVIAQEVEEVLPEVVETDDNGMKAVAYGNMVGLLIEAMKEQQKQIDELKAKLESYGS